MLVTLSARCKGSTHQKEGKPLQDYCKVTSDKLKTYAYALVADGHGGKRYIRSEKGSEIAVRCAVECTNAILKQIFQFIPGKNKDLIEKNLKLLCVKISIKWKEEVINHFNENPLSQEETERCNNLHMALPLKEEDIPSLYGSTLLEAVYFEMFNFWFALQIGDGKCTVIKTNNTVFSPEELENEKLGFGVTTSLCSKDAATEFRFAYGFEKINGISVMSDGMADSFDTSKLPDFILNLKNNTVNDGEKTQAELQDFLPVLSEQGSGDDISIAAIFSKKGFI
ncbi:MAG: protein phosphatase 2C domain-containing protein [Treponema sp.]|nr:protein phosphatase 2C domain-containing protein [Candidatus Treponema merdequi]